MYTLLYREISKEDFDLDINSMQKELDNLKDILSGQITLDSTLVSSLFNVDDGLPNMYEQYIVQPEALLRATFSQEFIQ